MLHIPPTALFWGSRHLQEVARPLEAYSYTKSQKLYSGNRELVFQADLERRKDAIQSLQSTWYSKTCSGAILHLERLRPKNFRSSWKGTAHLSKFTRLGKRSSSSGMVIICTFGILLKVLDRGVFIFHNMNCLFWSRLYPRLSIFSKAWSRTTQKINWRALQVVLGE